MSMHILSRGSGKLASASVAASTRLSLRALASSSSYVDVRDTPEGMKRRKNFWSKWGDLSAQAFWQDVGFDHDRTKEGIRTGMTAVKARKKKKGKPSGDEDPYELRARHNLDEEEYFDAEDAVGAAMRDGFDLDSPDGGRLSVEAMDQLFGGLPVVQAGDDFTPPLNMLGPPGRPVLPSLTTEAAQQRAKSARQALMGSNEGVERTRRAELLTLLEDLGPDGLLPPPAMPKEDMEAKLGITSLLAEDMSKSLQTTRNFMDACSLRESGALSEGSYFAYLLNTRMVSKVGPEGKRSSFSCLAVVGNGAGTAGIGMGKDLNPGKALYKATIYARKNLVHIDRFDNRTLFHAVDDRFARTKILVRLRRPGSGTRCSWLVWKMLSAFGISDVSVKIHGSRNPNAVANALVNTLRRMTSAQKVADAKGIRVLDMNPEDVRVPGFGPGTFLDPIRGR